MSWSPCSWAYIEEVKKNMNEVKNAIDKWLTNFVIPQVYDDSLSYYEEINKIAGCLNELANILQEEANNLLKETEERKAEDAKLQTNINAEATARTEGDKKLTESLTTETTERKAEDARLNTSIEAETTARTQGDEKLTQDLNTERDARISADNTINAKFSKSLTMKINYSTYDEQLKFGTIDNIEFYNTEG